MHGLTDRLPSVSQHPKQSPDQRKGIGRAQPRSHRYAPCRAAVPISQTTVATAGYLVAPLQPSSCRTLLPHCLQYLHSLAPTPASRGELVDPRLHCPALAARFHTCISSCPRPTPSSFSTPVLAFRRCLRHYRLPAFATRVSSPPPAPSPWSPRTPPLCVVLNCVVYSILNSP